MKKLFFLLFALIPLIAVSQKAKIEFETTSHNFGTISETGGPAVYDFVFKNTGSAPLILNNVRPGCGCTTPSWSRKPIAPGESGSIKVSFNPLHRPGNFNKGITVTSNAENAIVSLTIRGNVSKKPVDPYAAYSYSVGKLKIASNTLNLGNITNNSVIEKTLDIVNSGDQPLTINIPSSTPYINATVTPTTLQKGEKGKINVKYDAAGKKDWGFVTDKLNLQVNNNEKGEIAVAANIREDFSKVKSELAPVAVFSEQEAQLGTLTKNTTQKHEFYIQNDGKSDLIIRKIKTSDNTVTVNPAKTTIKPGKKTKVNVVLKTDAQPGKKIKIVSFTLNDPKNPIVTYKLSGNVQ